MIAHIAKDFNIPLYIIADSWKYATKNVKLEQRHFKEVWGTKKIHIKNPAFGKIPAELITKIVTELGTHSYKQFLTAVKKRKN